MQFGKRQDERKERGLPPTLRRQILLLVALLLGLLLLVLQFNLMGPKSDESRDPGFVGPGAVIGMPLEPEGSVSGFPLPEIQPPDAFEEQPEVLELGKAVDKTNRFDDRLIAYLLQKVRTRETLLSDRPALSMDREEKVFEQLIADPETYRGELIEVKGEVVSPQPGGRPLRLVGIDFPNPSGQDRVYQSFLVGVDAKYYMVATARKERDLVHRDSVRLRGYFCQLFSYPVQLRGQMVKATIPFLVGDDYEPLPRPKVEAPWTADYLPLLGALGAFAMAAVVLLRGRSGKQYEKKVREAREKLRESRRAAPPSGDSAPAEEGAP